MKKESLSLTMPKLIMIVSLIVGIGAALGMAGHLIDKQESGNPIKKLFTLCKNDFNCPLQTKCENLICVDIGCVKEGETTPGAINPEYKKHMATKCCKDLKAIENLMAFDEDCNLMGLMGGGRMCSNCGNGVCEEWESKCNCFEDCK